MALDERVSNVIRNRRDCEEAAARNLDSYSSSCFSICYRLSQGLELQIVFELRGLRHPMTWLKSPHQSWHVKAEFWFALLSSDNGAYKAGTVPLLLHTHPFTQLSALCCNYTSEKLGIARSTNHHLKRPGCFPDPPQCPPRPSPISSLGLGLRWSV